MSHLYILSKKVLYLLKEQFNSDTGCFSTELLFIFNIWNAITTTEKLLKYQYRRELMHLRWKIKAAIEQVHSRKLFSIKGQMRAQK